jgi:hypothetical protein
MLESRPELPLCINSRQSHQGASRLHTRAVAQMLKMMAERSELGGGCHIFAHAGVAIVHLRQGARIVAQFRAWSTF